MTVPIEIRPLSVDWIAGYLGVTEISLGGAAGVALVTAELLDAAAALIADPACWTRCAIARNAAGFPVDFGVDTAVRHCAAGALYRASADGSYDTDAVALAGAILNMTAVNSGFRGGLTELNDDTRDAAHAGVLEAYRQAAATLRGLSYRGLARAVSERVYRQADAGLHSA